MIGSAKAQEGTLVGKIKSTGTLGGSIKSNGVLVASLSMPVGYDDYVGEYDITPKIESQVMRKLMLQNRRNSFQQTFVKELQFLV